MHAERDDAPYYLQTKREKPWRVMAIMTIGSVITLGAITLLPGPALIKAPPLANVQPTTYKPQRQNYSDPRISERSKQDDYTHREVSTPAYPQLMPEQEIEKQTSFDNTNYIPKGAVNVVSYQEPEQTAPIEANKKKKLEIVVVGEERRLRDYCPYREGSIERRNCRMQVDLNTRNKNYSLE